MGKRLESEVSRREFWRMVLETHQAGGLSVRAFCEREGFSQSSFYFWRH